MSISVNRTASFKYLLEREEFVCGAVLTGKQVKDAKNGSVSVRDSYCRIDADQLTLVNVMFKGEAANVKLLVSEKELDSMRKQMENKSNTIVPTEVLSVNGWVKFKVRVASGKKKHDKRAAEKEKQIDRETRNSE